MNRQDLVTTLKNKLIARVWTGSSTVVFPTGSVVVSKAPLQSALATMRTPIAQIIPGALRCDPDYREDPALFIFDVTVRVIVMIPGDHVGENPIIGANRASSTTSEGAGLFQIEAEVFAAIGALNTNESLTIQLRQTSGIGAEYVDDKTYMAYQDLQFEAVATAT